MSEKGDREHALSPVNQVILSVGHFHERCSSSDCSNFSLFIGKE